MGLRKSGNAGKHEAFTCRWKVHVFDFHNGQGKMSKIYEQLTISVIKIIISSLVILPIIFLSYMSFN